MQKSTFNQFKTVLGEKLKDMSTKSVDFLSTLFNKVDYNLLAVLQTLKEHQQRYTTQIQRYLNMHEELSKKQKIIQELQEKIAQLSNQQNEQQIIQLRTELQQKMQQLIDSEQTQLKLSNKISGFEEKIAQVTGEKHSLELERIHLRTQYNQALNELKIYKGQLSQFNDKLVELEQQKNTLQTLILEASSTADIDRYEAELSTLNDAYTSTLNEKNILLTKIATYEEKEQHLQKDLLEKLATISDLTTQIAQFEHTLQLEKEKQREQQKKLTNIRHELTIKNGQLSQLEYKFQQIENEKAMLQAEIHQRQQDAENDLELYASIEKELKGEIEQAKAEIEILKNQLLDEQNNVAIAKSENSEKHQLSEKDKQILKQEFKPRFATLYQQCRFEEQFFKDFLQITPSDRLQVESAIAQLAYKYETAKGKIRPNAVKAKSKTFLEYPFSTDGAGRIYFIHTQHQFHFYRISRVKNGKGNLTQDNVITWLQKKY